MISEGTRRSQSSLTRLAFKRLGRGAMFRNIRQAKSGFEALLCLDKRQKRATGRRRCDAKRVCAANAGATNRLVRGR